MAALPPERVYQGVWIDYTNGPILGATITTNSARANLVIAFLSLLVTFAGSHLWDLIAFTRYWLGASDRAQTIHHRQTQILLRNITSPGAFVLEIGKVVWTWRHASVWRSLLIVQLLAFLCSAGFLGAGIFISQLVFTTNLHVLVSSSSCGWLSWRNETSVRSREYQQLAYSQARTYMDMCYNRTSELAQCNVYVTGAISVNESGDVPCPFQDLCMTETALRLQTDLLDSNEVFGINTDDSVRVQLQRSLTCAPLDLQKYATARPLPVDYARYYRNREPVPGEQLYEWLVGPLTSEKLKGVATYVQSSYDLIYVRVYELTPRVRYAGSINSPPEFWYNSTFEPIAELHHEQADVLVMGIQTNGVQFYVPNEDPLFAAHKPLPVLFDDDNNKTMYTSDQPTTFLGCIEQTRFCFPKTGCTNFYGVNAAYEEGQTLAPTVQQKSMVKYLSLQMSTMYYFPQSPMLVDRNGASFHNGIPADQWKYEQRSWFNFNLAMLQTSITHLAAGPGIVRADFDEIAKPLEWPGMCDIQRMGAPDGFSNISVLGLVLT